MSILGSVIQNNEGSREDRKKGEENEVDIPGTSLSWRFRETVLLFLFRLTSAPVGCCEVMDTSYIVRKLSLCESVNTLKWGFMSTTGNHVLSISRESLKIKFILYIGVMHGVRFPV